MKLGICTSLDHAELVAAAELDFVEEHVQNFLVPEQPDEVFAKTLEAVRGAPVPVRAANCFLPGDLKCVGPGVDRDRLARYGASAFRRAGQAGIEIIVFGSGQARQIPEGFSREQAAGQFVEALTIFGPMAAEHGVTLVVEPLNSGECNFINSLAEGASMVEACDHPAVRLLADIFHMLRDDEPASEIERFGSLLHHVHIAEKDARTPPGTAGDDFSAYLDALQRAGYDRRLAMECVWTDLPAQVARGADELRRQIGQDRRA